MKYIVIRDTNGNRNIWMIVNENTNTYDIKSRNTVSTVKKSDCFIEVNKDSLISYYVTEQIRDIESSNIEIESEIEYDIYCGLVKDIPNEEWDYTHI